jgi:hypothetical protein
MAVGMIRITKRCAFFGEKARIVSFPDRRNGKYGIQVVSSLETFELDRKDFVFLRPAKTRAR